MYFWNGVDWRQLPTRLDTYFNIATAPTQGRGLYALMSSLEIPLYGPGWNLISYPVQVTRPVTVALQSIADYYTEVYGYNAQDQSDPWKVYSKGVPDWVNDLRALKFGQGYWVNITTTTPITLYLKGGTGASLAAQESFALPNPPATFYGRVLAGLGFTPTAGQPVTAWVNGHNCGQGRTLDVDGQVVYTLNVFAEGAGDAAGCGAPGRSVTFKVGEQVMTPTAAWDNNRLWELPLQAAPTRRLYLPLITSRW